MHIDILEQSFTQERNILIKALLTSASDYIEKCKELGLCEAIHSTEIKKKMDSLNKHTFAKWLNEDKNFSDAKKKLINQKLINSNVNDINSDSLLSLRKIFSLEFITANVVVYMCSKRKLELNEYIINKQRRKIKNFINLLSDDNLDLINQCFELEVDWHLFVLLAVKLRKGKDNIYNSGKSHPYIFREFMIKRIIGQLYGFFGDQITDTCVADIAINITGIFFVQEMSRYDAMEIAKKVRIIEAQNQKLLNTTIGELIFSSKA